MTEPAPKPAMVTFVDMPFADGIYRFHLPQTQMQELEAKCGVGIGALFARVLRGRDEDTDGVFYVPQLAAFHAQDLIETVRQALLGGNHGMADGVEVKITPMLVNRLINTYVLSRPLKEAWELAAAILGAAMLGVSAKPAEDGESGPTEPAPPPVS